MNLTKLDLNSTKLLGNSSAIKLLNNVTSFLVSESNQNQVLLNTRPEVVDHLLADQIGTFETPVEENGDTSVLKLIHDYLLVFLLASVMFSMGCGITIHEVWNHLRRPTAVSVCVLAQFFMVPLLSFIMIVGLEIEALHATGLLILACCPGGVSSNIFTYIADGDLSLSITMTSVATIASMLLMPLNIWLYGRNLEAESIIIPYIEMSGTLILITIPVILGMVLNYHVPKITPYITKIGAVSGFGIIFICQTLEVFIFPDIFVGVPWKLYVCVVLLPTISFFAGLFFARLCRLNEKICRTIGIEIGIKNVGTALTIISLSLTMEQLKKAWIFPILYATSSFITIFIVIMFYKTIVNYNRNKCDDSLPTSDKDQIQAEECERQALRKKTEICTVSENDDNDCLQCDSKIKKSHSKAYSKLDYEKAL